MTYSKERDVPGLALVGVLCCTRDKKKFVLTDTLIDYVDNNPEAFTEAYWDFASIRVYE